MIEYNRKYVENQKFHRGYEKKGNEKSYLIVGIFLILLVFVFI